VEDEAEVRTRTFEILEDYFYRVDVAVDGVDALEKFKQHYELKLAYLNRFYHISTERLNTDSVRKLLTLAALQCHYE
jgi:CheY-like chemotaxis protein